MLYSVVDPTLTQKIIDAFEAALRRLASIQQRMLTNPLGQRLAAETEAAHTVADLVLTTDRCSWRRRQRKAGWPICNRCRGSTLSRPQCASRFAVTVGHVPYSIVWNTNRVTSPPQEWKDLADPQWQGKLLLIDPRIGGLSPLSWYVLMRQTYGDGFITAIGQWPRFSPSVVPGLQQIAAGRDGGLCARASIRCLLDSRPSRRRSPRHFRRRRSRRTTSWRAGEGAAPERGAPVGSILSCRPRGKGC